MGELIDVQLAKLGDIENLASSMEGVVFEYPPGSDKIYKLTGAFAMANQIIGRARRSGMTEEEEIELDIVDDEADDPVVDADFPKTIAVVPGAFKPPHKGHLDMVRKYASMVDEVIVLISKPTSRGRTLPNGKEVTAEDSLKIWNLLTAELPNVNVSISTHASPINAAYEYVGEDGPLNTGDKVALGCSRKDNDCSRWAGAEKYIKDGVGLIPPKGVKPSVRANGEPYSATAFREALGDPLNNREEIADFVGEQNVDGVLEILGLSAVDETSAMGGGAVGGFSGPLGSTSGKKRKKAQQDTIIRQENIDLNIVDEVMELIIGRGIIS
jgi:cytidyltransferase-like protein